MNHEPKNLESRVEVAVTTVRSVWNRPEFRVLDACEAEADVNANTDGSAFS